MQPADVNQSAYYGLVSNVVGRTPDLIVVPQAGVVFASPGKKLAEHGGLMQPDLNVALLVYAPNLATAGTMYNSTVRILTAHPSVQASSLHVQLQCMPVGPSPALPMPG